MQRNLVQDFLIPPKSAAAFEVKAGQYLRIIDVEGQQVGDLALFNAHDHSDKLNPSYTRQWVSLFDPDEMLVRSMFRGITTGNQLISSVRHVLATITADTPQPAGVHDLVMRSCSRWIYEEAARAGICSVQDGCLELLGRALAPHGIAMGDVPDVFNVFMNVQYDAATGMFVIKEPVSRPGDYIELHAEMDLLGALSACPDDVCSQCNGKAPHPAKPLRVQIFN
jgi:hypothetical protein